MMENNWNGILPNGGSYVITLNDSATYILVSREAYDALHTENEQLRKRIAELEREQIQDKRMDRE